MSELKNLEDKDFVPFGEDENLSCLLVKKGDGAHFAAVCHVRRDERKFDEVKKIIFKGEDYVILIFCRTVSIKSRVKTIVNMAPGLLDVRKTQAANADLAFYTVELNDNEHTMIYYPMVTMKNNTLQKAP